MTPAERRGTPGRTVAPLGWTRVGVAGLAALATILSGCTSTSPSGTDATPSGVNASESSGQSAEAKPSGSTESGTPTGGSSTGPSAKVPDPPSGKDGTAPKPSGKKGKAGQDSPAEKPTLESRPESDLSDEEIRDIYSDDVEPGAQVTATLCNLTEAHLELLEKHVISRDGVDDSNLRLALISLGDLLDVWEGLTWHLPEAAADIDTAREIYAAWDFALALQESGDSAGAQEQLGAASEAIDRLPADPDAELGCGG